MRVAAWVDGSPVPAADVDARLEALRRADAAAALPRADSREGRQLCRWVAQVVVVERLCESAAMRLAVELEGQAPAPPAPADRAALGSVVAAAWAQNPVVARVADVVTRDVRLTAEAQAEAARLGAGADGVPVWSAADLLRSARMEAFTRWVTRQVHERVHLEEGYEHPGDSAQPDHLHEH